MSEFKRQPVIQEKTIGSAWLHLLALTASAGEEVQDAQQGTILEILSPQLEIPLVSFPDSIVSSLGSEEMIESMRRNFFSVQPVSTWGFSYGERLFAVGGRNQVEWAASRLQRDPNTKSATISLLDPAQKFEHIPCVAAIDLKIRADRLRMHSFLRSSDVFRKFYADAACILELGQKLVGPLSVSGIDLIFSIASAHLYLKDVEAACALLKAAEEAHAPVAASDAVQRLSAVLHR
ncbi:MAG: thymidylate synthase [Thermoanaerobaculia bacterium]